jgi:hypothetical protein
VINLELFYVNTYLASNRTQLLLFVIVLISFSIMHSQN